MNAKIDTTPLELRCIQPSQRPDTVSRLDAYFKNLPASYLILNLNQMYNRVLRER